MPQAGTKKFPVQETHDLAESHGLASESRQIRSVETNWSKARSDTPRIRGGYELAIHGTALGRADHGTACRMDQPASARLKPMGRITTRGQWSHSAPAKGSTRVNLAVLPRVLSSRSTKLS